MKVVAKYRTVHVTYPNGDVECINCKSIKDAISFTEHFVKVIPFRSRAINDKSYLNVFYAYLKEKGYVETSLHNRRILLAHKAELVKVLAQHWV